MVEYTELYEMAAQFIHWEWTEIIFSEFFHIKNINLNYKSHLTEFSASKLSKKTNLQSAGCKISVFVF